MKRLRKAAQQEYAQIITAMPFASIEAAAIVEMGAFGLWTSASRIDRWAVASIYNV